MGDLKTDVLALLKNRHISPKLRLGLKIISARRGW